MASEAIDTLVASRSATSIAPRRTAIGSRVSGLRLLLRLHINKAFCSGSTRAFVSLHESLNFAGGNMRETEGKFATFVLLMAMMLTASGHLWAQAEEDETSIVQPDATTVRLTARSTAIINGIRAELRGDYRAAGAPIRLNAQL